MKSMNISRWLIYIYIWWCCNIRIDIVDDDKYSWLYQRGILPPPPVLLFIIIIFNRIDEVDDIILKASRLRRWGRCNESTSSMRVKMMSIMMVLIMMMIVVVVVYCYRWLLKFKLEIGELRSSKWVGYHLSSIVVYIFLTLERDPIIRVFDEYATWRGYYYYYLVLVIFYELLFIVVILTHYQYSQSPWLYLSKRRRIARPFEEYTTCCAFYYYLWC